MNTAWIIAIIALSSLVYWAYTFHQYKKAKSKKATDEHKKEKGDGEE